MLFFRCVGCAYVDHGPAGPRLLRPVEVTAGVVIDDGKPVLAGADVEVAVSPDAKGQAADLWPRGARHEVENAVIVPGLGVIAHKARRLPKIDDLIVTIASPCRHSTYRTSRAVRICSLDVLTVAAQPNDDRRTQGIRVLDSKRALANIVADADCRVDRPLLHSLRTGRKHADRQLEIPVHGLAGRPVLRLLVVK